MFGMGTGVTSSLLLPDYAGRPIIGALLRPLRLVTPSRMKIRFFVPILVSSNHLMLVVHLEKDSLKTKSRSTQEEKAAKGALSSCVHAYHTVFHHVG